MSKKYLVGVDGGTQSSKVVIFDLQGNVVCQGKEPLKPLDMPEPGVVEHPDDDLWDSLVILWYPEQIFKKSGSRA